MYLLCHVTYICIVGEKDDKLLSDVKPAPAVAAKTKDDAYDAFMKEMETLL